ncbi:hypothetical protein QVD17_37900 [Tagetes erecta]|uniref:Uncharacterized protein n=1 Tax=Tagetes erecta TaxID=13708 RepID=A0AAD8JVJ7_TARER|nr:hypothetical protein QVD17_37900 [Tagetes erecta]
MAVDFGRPDDLDGSFEELASAISKFGPTQSIREMSLAKILAKGRKKLDFVIKKVASTDSIQIVASRSLFDVNQPPSGSSSATPATVDIS